MRRAPPLPPTIQDCRDARACFTHLYCSACSWVWCLSRPEEFLSIEVLETTAKSFNLDIFVPDFIYMTSCAFSQRLVVLEVLLFVQPLHLVHPLFETENSLLLRLLPLPSLLLLVRLFLLLLLLPLVFPSLIDNFGDDGSNQCQKREDSRSHCR